MEEDPVNADAIEDAGTVGPNSRKHLENLKRLFDSRLKDDERALEKLKVEVDLMLPTKAEIREMAQKTFRWKQITEQRVKHLQSITRLELLIAGHRDRIRRLDAAKIYLMKKCRRELIWKKSRTARMLLEYRIRTISNREPARFASQMK